MLTLLLKAVMPFLFCFFWMIPIVCIHNTRHLPHQTSTTPDPQMVWWMSGVVYIWCGGFPFYTWCGGCLMWWMSGVVGVLFYSWCVGCLVWRMSVWWMWIQSFNTKCPRKARLAPHRAEQNSRPTHGINIFRNNNRVRCN